MAQATRSPVVRGTHAISPQPCSKLPDMPGRVEIEYCVKCKWMLRATWICQELMSTFEKDQVISEIALKPSYEVAGVFDIRVDGVLVWSRKAEGRFPEAKEVKQKVRDILVPERNLGHSDAKTPVPQPAEQGPPAQLPRLSEGLGSSTTASSGGGNGDEGGGMAL
uniref:Selenoprotein W n=1 Tax=Alexandrium andersonii TaxID=327968 RepID=A0A7S2C4W5_9DINO